MKEKILFFHLLNNYTGSPLVLKNTILQAKEMGKEVHLYTNNGEGFLSGISGITYHSNYYVRSEYKLLTFFTFFMSQFILAFKLLKYKGDSCTFYVNTILPFSAILVGRMIGKVVLVHVHEYEIKPRLLNDFLFWIVRSYSSKIIVVSQFLAQNPSLSPRETRVIYNSVSEEFENASKFEVEFKENFRVLMLASLRPYKGIGEFLQLAQELPNVGFDLILSDSEEDVNSWKSHQVIPENLIIVSVQKNVVGWFESASLVINLTHKDECVETFGMTILEGMKFGLPAIVPTTGGITELVEDGKNGFLIDHSDLIQLKFVIKKMQAEPHYWLKLSQGALHRSRIFSREVFANEMSLLLK